ncbi:50S ribosomal subunit protein L24 [Candidatus Zinderia insecticola CARI]|uniref:Large ribosomal subunit protein uL24 n=1 Tax=Zinderia insecticola (strain CARI) TaxID=871271 RepID=E0TJ37_ZINIC|nr:50S ribosomal subunit protein L24 [Candidatus Zinderia insecticola CARI]
MKKIRKNDEVIIICGKDKGKIGFIKKIVNKNYVKIYNLNVFKKNQKLNLNKKKKGGIINKIMPIHISNISLYNNNIKKKDKCYISILNNKKIRIYKLNNKII